MTDAYDPDQDLDSAALEKIKNDMGYEDTERGEDTSGVGERSERSQRRRMVVTAENSGINLSYHPSGILMYSQPRQRQKWGETQVLPRVNWGDLFFDLIYVAATYNVSYILTSQPDREGLLYAAGTFLPVMNFWTQKVFYDGRFVFEDDLFHRLSQLLYLLVLATAVVHIRPVYYMSNASEVFSMFCFSLMMVAGNLLNIFMSIETYFFGVGQRANLKHVSLQNIRYTLISTAFFVAAVAVSAKEYDGEDGSDGHRRSLAAESAYDDSSTAGDYNTTSDTGYGYASEEKSYGYSDSTNIPIWLILAGHVSYLALFSANIVFCYPTGGRHKEFSIPVNIDFVMHRNGEWIMLMLGESVFSLLIVDIPEQENNFFATFYCGIMTVVFLYHLHFQSQPHSPDSHALRRDKNAGMMWTIFQQVYSLALVSLGASFTFFLQYYQRKSTNRRLAGEAEQEDLQDEANILFCLSLAMIFFCLDMMSFLHLGWKESQGRCVCQHAGKYKMKVVMLPVVRAGIIVFTATMYKWETSPKTLSIIALLMVVLQLFIRRVGAKYASHNQVHAVPHH